MKIASGWEKEEYLSALKENMGDRFAFHTERFTGFFFGNCFSVTHHAGHTWNRRITNEKNTAVGFLRQRPEGCEICFLHVRGILAPSQFLLYLLFITVVYLIPMLAYSDLPADLLPVMLLVSLGTTGVLAVVSAIAESFTAEGEAGRKALFSLLMDPENPYEYINKV